MLDNSQILNMSLSLIFADQNRDSQGKHKNSKCADPLFFFIYSFD